MPVRSRSRCCSEAMYCLPPSRSDAQLVELGVVAGADHAAVGQRGRRPIDQRRGELAGEVGQQVELVGRRRSAARRPSAAAIRQLGERARPRRAAAGASRGARPARAAWRDPPRRGRRAARRRARRRAPRAAGPGPGRRARATSTASSRASIAAGSRSGESSHWRSSRPPIGVTRAVDHLEQGAAPRRRRGAARPARGCGGSSRRARGTRSLRRTTGRARCGRPPGCSSPR